MNEIKMCQRNASLSCITILTKFRRLDIRIVPNWSKNNDIKKNVRNFFLVFPYKNKINREWEGKQKID